MSIPRDTILASCRPYVVLTPWNRPFFNLRPFGVSIEEEQIFDPMRLSSEVFLELLETMDGLTFGPEGMPMPKWVFYNCSELPGGIMGFGRLASELTDQQLESLRVPDGYQGLVPLSMFIAIPMLQAGDWMGHNLASMNGVFPAAGLRGLGSMTKAFGLCVYRTVHQYGATQWHSRALNIHTKFGPLELVTAYTPAHSDHMTLTYRVKITEERLRAACGDPDASVDRPETSFWLDADDEDRARELQDEIEAGALYAIVNRPRLEDGRVLHPIASIE